MIKKLKKAPLIGGELKDKYLIQWITNNIANNPLHDM